MARPAKRIRSSKFISKLPPSAPISFLSSHAVKAPAAAARKNIGSSGIISRFHDRVPLFHQMITNRAGGSMTVAVLEKSASAKRNGDSTYSKRRRDSSNLRY